MPPVSTATKGNPLVDFLASYGPSSSSDALSDEHVQAAELRHGVRAIRAPAPRLDTIRECLLGENPTSVILTGTAGDGKTYHIRRFFLDELQGNAADWPGKSGIIKTTVQGRPLRIIRDLSQLTDTAKAEEIEHVTRCLLGDDTETLYLVAANDGQLLKFWRDARQGAQGEPAARVRYDTVLSELTDMLHRDLEQAVAGTLQVRLVNLSRSADGKTFDDILDSILDHEAWNTGCASCPQSSPDQNTCPIRLNRELIRGVDPGRSRNFRDRLKQAVRIAALNDQHIPIRQLIMLAVNILLGDTKKRDQPLLSCATARRRGRDNEFRYCNPFNNAVGLNVRHEKRRALTVFSALETFGVGYETSTVLDGLLLDGVPVATADMLIARDPVYGPALFEQRLRAYKAGADYTNGEGFGAALEAQRRRLFFLLDDAQGGPLSPWKLTIFHHASEYLAFTDTVKTEVQPKSAPALEVTLKKLVKGINRTLTGMMVEETERMWLARSIGRAEGAGRFTTLAPVERRGFSNQHLEPSVDASTGRPRLSVALKSFGQPRRESVALQLRPLLFEYLMRVADGSLPSSFSRQCQQEVRHFALSVSSFIQSEYAPDGEDTSQIRILSVARDGMILPRDIGA
jgi:hypothetical protein